MTGTLWGSLGGNNRETDKCSLLGGRAFFFFKQGNALTELENKDRRQRKVRKKGKKKEKNYSRLQAEAHAAALANTSALHILKICTSNASDYWFAIFLIPALLFPYESNSLLSFRVWFDRYRSHFTFVFSSSYTITHWVPCEITIVHFQLSNPFAVQK